MVTIRGLSPGTLKWQPDFQATHDASEDSWSATVSFICNLADVVTLRPQKGAGCLEPGFAFLTYTGCTVENISGGLGRITCKYSGGESQDFEFGFDDDGGKYRTELAISTSEEPVESHFRYKDVTAEDRIKIAHLKAGRMKPTATPNEYVLKEGSEHGKKFTFTEERAAELAEKIAKGITSYLACNQCWRVQYTTKNKIRASILNKVGKIANAKGAPSISEDRDWLFMGASVQEQGDIYSVSLEWRLSGPGGWDAELYGEGDE